MLTPIQSFWTGLEARQRLIAVLSALAIAAAVFGISRVATAPNMALLYSGLDSAAAGEVVAALEADGVPFEVRDSSILVERSERDRVRMNLAARGLPAGGPAGYEILDGLSGFGTTSQMFDAAYWRAKEGELARTITASRNVRAARVHLANPSSAPFSRTPTGSASVTVTMASGALDKPQAEAIRYLVSSAVAGISPDGVAVIDSGRGVVLGAEDDGFQNAALQDPNLRAETLRGNILRLLEARVGPGRAIVEVSVDADMDSETITERVIDPDSRVAISSEVEENKENAEGGPAGVTIASNLPDGDVQAGAGDASRSSSQSRERQNFEISETRRERIVLPGQVRRINVAVMVDGVIEPSAEGTPVWAPRPEAEMATLRQLVQTAAGFNAERGDTVTIESLQFTTPPEQGAFVENAGDGFFATHGARIIQMGVLGAIVIALILFVLRPLLARRPAVEYAELSGPREHTGDGQRHIGGSGHPSGDILQLPPHALTKVERLREVITSRSDDSAAVLRSWIESPDSHKEPAGS